MSHPKENLAILLRDDGPYDTGRLAPILAKYTGMHPTDAAQTVNWGGGILAEEIVPEIAKGFLTELEKEGFRAFGIPMDRFVELPRKIKVSQANLEESHFDCAIGHDQNRQQYQWSSIAFVHAFVLEEVEHIDVDQLDRKGRLKRSGPSSKKRWLVDPRDRTFTEATGKILEAFDTHHSRTGKSLELYIQLLSLEPVALLEIPNSRFNYRHLGERVAPHSIDNYLTTLSDILGRTRQSVVPDSTWRLLEHQDVQVALFSKTEHLLRYLRWQVNRILAKNWGLIPEWLRE